MTEPAGGETRGTVVLALLANVGVALAKIVGGVVTGSPALLAEAAHSVADTLNEIFLFISLGRAERPADRTHPFGYGKERFFWSFLAAVFIFVSGAGFSLYQGLSSVLAAERATSTTEFVVVYVVLGLSLPLEGSSLLKAVRQVRREARAAGRTVGVYVARSTDPTVKTVASEDAVAVVGIVVAAVGTVLHQVTGRELWEGVASFVIAALLAFVALRLGRDAKELLIDQSADPSVRLVVVDVLGGCDEVERVSEILTMQLSPTSVLVACRLQFREHLRAREIESVCTGIEDEMRRRVPALTQVFLDPSSVTDEEHTRSLDRLDRNVAEVQEIEGDEAQVLQDVARTRAGRTRQGRRLGAG